MCKKHTSFILLRLKFSKKKNRETWMPDKTQSYHTDRDYFLCDSQPNDLTISFGDG